MHAVARSAKPKLSLSISTTATASSRPSLSLSTTVPRTPVSPSPLSPTARNTRFNQHRGYAVQAMPSSYAYVNSSSSKSILKKAGHSSSSSASKRLQFSVEPTVHCITPIENKEDYYGAYTKMSKEERRWSRY